MYLYYCLTILILLKVKTPILTTTQTIKSLILNSSYDATIQPRDSVLVHVGISFKQIVKLDQSNQILTSSSTLTAIWNDQRLTWDDKKYSMKAITLKAKQIWLPDLYIINSADSNGFAPVTDFNLVTVFSTGDIFINYALTNLNTRCTMNVYKFPYDIQTCLMIVGSWSQSSQQINMTYTLTYSSNNFVGNSIWDVKNAAVSVENSTRLSGDYPTNDVHFIISIKRKPMYYILNNVYPCLILNIVTLFTFYFQFAQQTSLTLTTFLSMAVISVRAAGDLPVISDYMPLISLYFFLSLLYTFISFVWFAATNSFKSSGSLPILLKKLAELIIRIKKAILKRFKTKIENLKNQLPEKNENDALISTLNDLAFCLMTITMFVSYLSIWLIISN